MRLSPHRLSIESQEPVGLVIADGGLGDHVPRFSAFVWGPVPDEEPLPSVATGRGGASRAEPLEPAAAALAP